MSGKNKGEWSELLVFCKIIKSPNKILYDNELGNYLNIHKIIRKNKHNYVTYRLLGDGIVMLEDNSIIYLPNFNKFIDRFFLSIKKDGRGSFELPYVSEYLKKHLGITQLTRGNTDKVDLKLNYMYGKNEISLNVDIKSCLAAAPSLINLPGKSKKINNNIFVFKVKNILKNELNLNKKAKSIIKELYEKGGNLEQIALPSKNCVLKCILGEAEFIVGQLIIEYLLTERDRNGYTNHLWRLLEVCKKNNVLNIDLNTWDCLTYKVFDEFLKRSTVNKLVSTVSEEAVDCIVGIKNNGDLYFNRFFNDRSYLNHYFNRAVFDTGSTKRHGIGRIVEEDNELFFKWQLGMRYRYENK